MIRALCLASILFTFAFRALSIFQIYLAFVPDAFQGRVNSAARLMSFASQPLGLAATGVLIQTIGTSSTVLIGAGVLLFVALMATMSRHMRTAANSSSKIEQIGL